MVQVQEPTQGEIEKAVKSLQLTLHLIDADPTARGAKDMLEAWYGESIDQELVQWLRNPREKRKLRDRFVMKMAEVWDSG